MTTTNTTNNSDQRLITAQKLCARQLMSAISKLPWTKDSVVAGGAPRDWFMDRPASDIDIFLIDTTIGHSQLIEHMEQAGFGGIKLASRKHSADPDEAETYYTNPKIKVVYDGVTTFRPSIGERGYVVKFQIVVTFCKSVAELLATFPVEISKFTWNHLTNKIIGEPGAIADVQNKTLTQTYRDITQGRYVRKIRDKFPDHLFTDVTTTLVAAKTKVLPPSPTVDQVRAIIKNIPTKPQVMFRDPSELSTEQVSAMINSGLERAKPLDLQAGKVRLEADMKNNPTAFAFWLQGFFEMTGATSVNEHQTQIIKDHLALVFAKVTPDRNNQQLAHEQPVGINDMDCQNIPFSTGDSLFSRRETHRRVVPPTAILPAKTLISC